jgi:hypothetical protein
MKTTSCGIRNPRSVFENASPKKGWFCCVIFVTNAEDEEEDVG